MCGLAGFARHPDAPGLDQAIIINRNLTVLAQARGRHATGFGVIGPTKNFIKKWAIDFDELLKNGLYKKEVEENLPIDTRYLMSHTRHATLANKRDDAAAHPYQFSSLVGCHNGTITNWQKIAKDNEQDDWLTDSQAALWLIDTMEDPAKALMALDGWWSLVWVKDGKLHLSRTNDRPLAVAYVEQIKTLFWASKEKDLHDVLSRASLKHKAWELTHDTIYQFDPKKFNSQSHPSKRKVKLNRPSAVHATKKDVYRGEPKYRSYFDKADPSQRELNWSTGKAKTIGSSAAQLSLKEMNARIEKIDSRLESAEAEIAFLYEVLDEHGVLGGEDDECSVCGESGGQLLNLPEGGTVHPKCVIE
jgi:predicted glutamine amidotransferase